jgi:hypothetical protein
MFKTAAGHQKCKCRPTLSQQHATAMHNNQPVPLNQAAGKMFHQQHEINSKGLQHSQNDKLSTDRLC